MDCTEFLFPVQLDSGEGEGATIFVAKGSGVTCIPPLQVFLADLWMSFGPIERLPVWGTLGLDPRTWTGSVGIPWNCDLNAASFVLVQGKEGKAGNRSGIAPPFQGESDLDCFHWTEESRNVSFFGFLFSSGRSLPPRRVGECSCRGL